MFLEAFLSWNLPEYDPNNRLNTGKHFDFINKLLKECGSGDIL